MIMSMIMIMIMIMIIILKIIIILKMIMIMIKNWTNLRYIPIKCLIIQSQFKYNMSVNLIILEI